MMWINHADRRELNQKAITVAESRRPGWMRTPRERYIERKKLYTERRDEGDGGGRCDITENITKENARRESEKLIFLRHLRPFVVCWVRLCYKLDLGSYLCSEETIVP